MNIEIIFFLKDDCRRLISYLIYFFLQIWENINQKWFPFFINYFLLKKLNRLIDNTGHESF